MNANSLNPDAQRDAGAMSASNCIDDAAKAELLELLLTATQDGIVDWNVQTGETVYNARWKHLLGFDSAELAEYHETPGGWRELIHPADTARTLRLLDDHVKEGWPLYTTLRMRHRHARYKHILLRGAAQRGQDDQALRVVLVFSDVDERIQDEQRQRAELVQAQKLGAIGQLAAGVAHQLDPPMQLVGDSLHFAKATVDDLLSLVGALRGALDRARQAPVGEATLAQLSRAAIDLDFEYVREALPAAIQRSLDGVERVTKIVGAMSSLAPPNGEQLSPTDLKSLIESTVAVATNEWKDVAEVELQLSPGLPLVPCRSSELSQVVLNLIVNASQAIAVVVGSSGAKGKISISAEADATHAMIRVADTGSGIPEHARGQVFDPFFTTKGVGKGTGQGLSMAYNCVVGRHKGSIDFETEPGVGTTFMIRLPRRAPAQGPSGAGT
jgi:two-component system, NtrC family, sensor kinase